MNVEPSQSQLSSSDEPAAQPATAYPARWLEEHGDALFRFALARIRDQSAAEDLVQETFLAAIQSRSRFAGRSTERAWLLGILRNKVIDHYRRQSRESSLAGLEAVGDDSPEYFHSRGLGKGGWVQRLAPHAWPAPDESLSAKEFWNMFHLCVSKLPEKMAQVFLLREMDDVASEEICKELTLSPNNLWVLLHRARMALRRCLELNWFGGRKS